MVRCKQWNPVTKGILSSVIVVLSLTTVYAWWPERVRPLPFNEIITLRLEMVSVPVARVQNQNTRQSSSSVRMTPDVAPSNTRNNDEGQRINRMISVLGNSRNKKIIDANVVSRTIPITSNWSITVWEWANPAAVIETYWQVEQQGLTLTNQSNDNDEQKPQQSKMLDPFGLVVWPGAVVAAQELLSNRRIIENKNVLILGAGVGIEAQAAAMLGASNVLATDIHPTTLQLLQYGAERSGLDHIIQTKCFDIASYQQSLPSLSSFDVMIVADVLYNEKLAEQVARRCEEARCSQEPPPIILITDSQRFVHNFETEINKRLQSIGEIHSVNWTTWHLPKFTGSGVLINDDQTDDVKARVLWIGLPTDSKT